MTDIRVCALCGRYFDTTNISECCGMSYVPPGRSDLYMWSALIQQEKEDYKRQHGYYPDFAPKKQYYKLPANTKKEILERDGNQCAECGSEVGLQVHHIVHRKNGGSDKPNNLITLCELCHAEKHRGEPIYSLMVKNIFKAIAV